MSICGCGRLVGLLACHCLYAALSRARSLFPVGLRAGASLRVWLRRRLCCRVISYSIPDDVMRITGSCGIRLVAHPACLLPPSLCRGAMWAVVVPLFVPSGGSPLSPACLMFTAVCLDASPRHRCSCLAVCRPLRSSARASSRFAPSSVPVVHVRVSSNCVSLLAPPHRHAGRGDTIALRRLSICLLAHRLAISSMRFGIGWRRGSVPAPLDCSLPVPRPMVIIGAACSTRSPNPIFSLLRFAFPPRLLDTGDGAESICAGSVNVAAGVVLLAWISYYVSCRWVMW